MGKVQCCMDCMVKLSFDLAYSRCCFGGSDNHFGSFLEHRKSASVMVTPKKCKCLQLCEHQLSVKVTPTWCTF